MKKLWTLIISFTICFADVNQTARESNRTNQYLPKNTLQHELSPYLLSHSDNRVHWSAWTPESLHRAQKENKLIFLSIGYSTCHWCHVMEEESFNNQDIAKLLNTSYISIKVDKEEFPHIDAKYQQLHAFLNQRRNGWPLNVILTPSLELLYISTYIPPKKSYGVEGMLTLLPKYSQMYSSDPKEVNRTLALHRQTIEKKEALLSSAITVRSIEEAFVSEMQKHYDPIYHGFYRSPKFPLASHLNLLLNIYALNGNTTALHMASNSLNAMQNGGIFDQVEGGFFRYSTLSDWVIPHFEKMLYSNAELSYVYLKAYKLTHNTTFKQTAFKTIDFINKKFRTQEGLYYSASDADSLNAKNEKEEGYYFTYNYKEVEKEFKQHSIENSEELLEYLGFEEYGNFENLANNVYILDSTKIKPQYLSQALSILKKIRQKRESPFIDRKINTAWNAMMIKSLFYASKYNRDYLDLAIESTQNLLHLLYKERRLYHYSINGKLADTPALLEDYVFVVDMLLEAYYTTLNVDYLQQADTLLSKSYKLFFSKEIWYLDANHFAKAGFKDKNYTAPLSRLFHNMLKIAGLTNNFELLFFTKNMLKKYKYTILNELEHNPEVLNAILRTKFEDMIIKGSGSTLAQYHQDIDKIVYPYLLVKSEKRKTYQVCSYTSCFKESQSFLEILNYVKKSTKP